MMEVSSLPDGRTKVSINFSSLDIISTCLRKAKYYFIDGFVSEDEADALTFGSAIHKALEHWYSLPVDQRDLPKDFKAVAENMAFGHELETPCTHGGSGSLEAVRQFCLRGQGLARLPEGDKRSRINGVEILKAYFKHYSSDGLTVVSDATGPIIERHLEMLLHEDAQIVINLHGTVDAVLENKQTGFVYGVDHKTTSQLGTQFYNRLKPNHQYTGYLMLVRDQLGIDTYDFMVNAIQVAKTKIEFARQITTRNEEDFAELKSIVIWRVNEFLSAKALDIWPMNAPNPCSSYGACSYLDACSSPNKLRNNILKAKYFKD